MCFKDMFNSYKTSLYSIRASSNLLAYAWRGGYLSPPPSSSKSVLLQPPFHPVHCLAIRRSELHVISAHGHQTLCFSLRTCLYA
jgi:hypothetical protein